MKKSIIIAVAVLIMAVAATGTFLYLRFNSDFEAGKVDGNVYTNESAKIKFTLPSGMQIASEDTKASELGTPQDGDIYDLYASDQTKAVSVAIMYTDIKKAGKSNSYSATDMVSDIKADYAKYKGTTTIKTETAKTVKFAGEDYLMLKSVVSGSVDVIEKMYIRKVGDFIVCVSITGLSDSSIDTVAATFEKP